MKTKEITLFLILSLLICSFIPLCVADKVHAKRMTSLSAAQKAAKKKVPSARITGAETDTEDGVSIYDITLRKGQKEYGLKFRASDGKLIEYKWKLLPSSSKGKYISRQKARNLALAKAPGARIIKIELDKDDGMAVYEIEMRKGAYEYDVKINAKTGSILEFDKDLDD